jgi:GT2 family glycosyltransferase
VGADIVGDGQLNDTKLNPVDANEAVALHTVRVSIVVPVRNRGDSLLRTLETLILQDFPANDYEVVVCDDGSTEDLTKTLMPFVSGPVLVRLERQPPLGPAAARNLGIRKSYAPVLIFIDSDVQADLALVRLLVDALHAHPAWMGAEAALHPIGKQNGILWDAPSSTDGGRYHTAAIAYRRDALLAVGGFDEEFKLPACEDVDLAVRVLKLGPIGFVRDAKAWHPRRKVTALTHWRWRQHWRYEAILAVRHGILTFPGRPTGPLPRLRVALSAVATLPAGRLLAAWRSFADTPAAAFLAALYALLDVFCAFWVLPSVLFRRIPKQRGYLDRSALARARRRRFAVVVGAHRTYATLESCLRGFRALVRDPADLIFVDNASDGRALSHWAKNRFPDITLITLSEDRLFCASYNAGIRYALERDYDFVLIANADTEVVNTGFVADLIEAMERHPRAAFVGPLVYYRDLGVVQTTCLRFPSLLRRLLVWLPYRLFPRMVSRQPTYEHQVEFLNGVCLLCRVQALREIGLMDETFGGYVEDTDWSWRARQRGWNSVFTPVPSLIHHEESRGYEHHSLKSFLLKRNTVYWLLKVGKCRTARGYAECAIALASLRAWLSLNREKRQAHREFVQRLQEVYCRLLAREAMGPWYGPPLNGPVSDGKWSW